jgi:hypothetical protein
MDYLQANMQITRIESVQLTGAKRWLSKTESWWIDCGRQQHRHQFRLDFLSKTANDPCLPQFRWSLLGRQAGNHADGVELPRGVALPSLN